jgi:outer membrane protein
VKHIFPGIAVLLLVFAAAAAVAQDVKIGFVDVERITRESAPAERASKQLEKEFAPRVKDAMTMAESERRNKEQELARLNVEYQRMQREYREDLNMRRNQELAALFERANRVIKQIADAEKFDLIVQEAAYRSPRIDITDRVLKALAEGI